MTSAEPTGRVALVTGAGRGIGAGYRPRRPATGAGAISGQAINVSGGHEMH